MGSQLLTESKKAIHSRTLAHRRNSSIAKTLRPISRAKLDTLSLLEVIHNLHNIPRLILVSLGIVGRNPLIIFQPDALLVALHNLIVILVRVCLGVMAPDPLRQARLSPARIELDLFPLGVLEQFGIRKAQFLGAGVADESVVSRGSAGTFTRRIAENSGSLTEDSRARVLTEERSPCLRSGDTKRERSHPQLLELRHCRTREGKNGHNRQSVRRVRLGMSSSAVGSSRATDS